MATDIPAPIPIQALRAAIKKRGLLDDSNLIRLERRMLKAQVATLSDLRQWLKKGDINPKVGATLSALLPRHDDQHLGECHILAHLAEGGMGRVDLVEHDGHLRVLKTIPASRSDREQAVRRFRREAEITAGIDHPNVVRCLTHGEDRGHLFLVLEYVPGGDVQQLLTQVGRLDEVEALTILRQTALGLGYAHDRHLVHRDIKPANIFITDDGCIRLADFGLARSTTDSGSLLTAPGGAVGTPCYMAPEQIRGEDLDLRCDLYALGCVLHACLTGKAPWNGSLQEVLQGHLHQPIPAMTTQRADIGSITTDLHHQLLEKDRTRRPLSAHQVAELAAVRLSEIGSHSQAQLQPRSIIRSTRAYVAGTVHPAGTILNTPDIHTADTQSDISHDDQATLTYERADQALVGDLSQSLAEPILYLSTVDQIAQVTLIAKTSLHIGRDPQCEAIILAENKDVSRRHCCISVSEHGHAAIEDLVSANGTWYERRWLPPGQAQELPPDGSIRIRLGPLIEGTLTTHPQRTPTIRQLSGAAPGLDRGLGIEHDAVHDAVVFRSQELRLPIAVVIRRVLIGGPEADIPWPGDHILECARYRDVWLIRRHPAPWQPLCIETAQRLGLVVTTTAPSSTD